MKRCVLLALVGLAVWVPGVEAKSHSVTVHQVRVAVVQDTQPEIRSGEAVTLRFYGCRRWHRGAGCWTLTTFSNGDSDELPVFVTRTHHGKLRLTWGDLPWL